MKTEEPRVPDAAAFGIDRTQLIAALRRTPKERFERGVQLARAAALFRKAKPVPRPR